MKQILKQVFLNVFLTAFFVVIFAFVPMTSLTNAQTSTTPKTTGTTTGTTTTTTTSGDRIQGGLDAIGTAFPDTVVAKDSTLSSLAVRVINIALYLAAIIAVIFVIIGGYQYIFSAGNDETAKTGRKTLTNALIGLTIIVLSYIIVQVVYKFLTDQT